MLNRINIVYRMAKLSESLSILSYGKASSELNEEVQPALSIGFHENQVGDFVYLLI